MNTLVDERDRQIQREREREMACVCLLRQVVFKLLKLYSSGVA